VSRVSHPTLARTLGVARPKVQHEYASSERPWDNGTRQGQLMFTIDTIMRFHPKVNVRPATKLHYRGDQIQFVTRLARRTRARPQIGAR